MIFQCETAYHLCFEKSTSKKKWENMSYFIEILCRNDIIHVYYITSGNEPIILKRVASNIKSVGMNGVLLATLSVSCNKLKVSNYSSSLYDWTFWP